MSLSYSGVLRFDFDHETPELYCMFELPIDYLLNISRRSGDESDCASSTAGLPKTRIRVALRKCACRAVLDLHFRMGSSFANF